MKNKNAILVFLALLVFGGLALWLFLFPQVGFQPESGIELEKNEVEPEPTQPEIEEVVEEKVSEKLQLPQMQINQ